MSPPLLGCIADDFTGAGDIALALSEAGARTRLLFHTDANVPDDDVDAVVIALKSRSTPVDEAVADSLAALERLKKLGAQRFYFKYCSTFDSTDKGNIGPVAEALMAAIGAPFAIACPSFPKNQRTVYMGHLFVGDLLISDTHMRDHPITPMREPNLVQHLHRQCRGRVSLIPYPVVDRGPAAIVEAFEAAGPGVSIIDAASDRHLEAIGAAAAFLPLVTGGSALGGGLVKAWREAGVLAERDAASAATPARGRTAVLSGSCSAASLRQTAHARTRMPTMQLDPSAGADSLPAAEEVAAWAEENANDGPVLIASSAPPDVIRSVQDLLGRETASTLIEKRFAEIAQRLHATGFRNFVVGGGETSGAVAAALGVEAARVGPKIDEGAPLLVGDGEAPVSLALKSGNFGGDDFYVRAAALMG